MSNNHKIRKNERKCNVIIDGIGYEVTTTPFDFNAQVRYDVQVNQQESSVFAWDTEMSMFKSLSDDASILPDGLIRAINAELLKA